MNEIFAYADESCHTNYDNIQCMALATVFCKAEHRKKIKIIIHKIMTKYKINVNSELKWTKISDSNVEMYIEIFDFLKNVSKYGDLGIRAILIKNKDLIKSSSDEFYHKMYFLLFKKIIDDNFIFNNLNKYSYHLIIDYKDSNSFFSLNKLGTFLSNYSSYGDKLVSVTPAINSNDHILIQIADVIAGSITYFSRGLNTSPAKLKLIEHIRNLFDVDYNVSTFLNKLDFNLLVWEPK